MRVGGDDYRTIWPAEDGALAYAIDQRKLPFDFEIVTIATVAEMACAISDVTMGGADPAPLLHAAANELVASRPTAVNLEWAVHRQLRAIDGLVGRELVDTAADVARAIADEDVDACAAIGVQQECRVAALEWAADGILVYTVHPDAVFDTGLWSPELIGERAAKYDMTAEDYRRRNLLGVDIGAADVARSVAALCTDDFRATTGAQIPIDGGNERVI